MRDGRRRPTHPGELLRRDFLPDYGLTAEEFAAALRLPRDEVAALLEGKRRIDADIALRLARYFGTSAEVWSALQRDVDFFDAKAADAAGIESIVPVDRSSALSAQEGDSLPEELLEDLRQQIADMDDTTRWMIVSIVLDAEPDDASPCSRAFYQVESGCWAVGIEHGTAFKRESAARAVAEGLGEGARVIEVSSHEIERIGRVEAADMAVRKRYLHRSRKGLRIWDPSQVLRSEDDMAAYLEAAAEEGGHELLSAAVKDVLAATRRKSREV